MKTSVPLSSAISLGVPSRRPGLTLPLLFVTVAMLLLLLSTASSTFADSATWNASPLSGDWDTAANWTPPSIPNGPSDIATFNSSNTTGVSLSADTEVNTIVFIPGASAFAITANPTRRLTISGEGIANNSGVTQNFIAVTNQARNFGRIIFANSATAGSMTTFTNRAGSVPNSHGARVTFLGSSTAAEATFINALSSPAGGSEGGVIEFFEHSTAANAIFINNGGRPQTQPGLISFHGHSTAASGTFTNEGGAELNAVGGAMTFNGASSAGNGNFLLNGGTVSSASGARISFFNTSNAASAILTINGGATTGAYGGEVDLYAGSNVAEVTFITNGGTADGAFGGVTASSASKGDGTFIANGSTVSGAQGANVFFFGVLGSATLIATAAENGGEGGAIWFSSISPGGPARVEVFGDGRLDISQDDLASVAVGSIEGTGKIVLGGRNLAVGSNNLSTTFSGVIQGSGTLTKIGSGKLVLKHRNTYSGGTTVENGKLFVNNRRDSGTGSGPVQVEGGRLGGKGAIAGAVTVGTGTGRRAVLSPGYLHGVDSPGTLTIQSPLSFNSDATYEVEVNSSSATADEVIANGVTINSGAQFSFDDLGNNTLTLGTVFTVVNNTAATPIAGAFSNLPDGGTFSSNGNTYQVNYHGGDGNDLTLTVVP